MNNIHIHSIYKILPDCNNDTDSMSVSSYEELISNDSNEVDYKKFGPHFPLKKSL